MSKRKKPPCSASSSGEESQLQSQRRCARCGSQTKLIQEVCKETLEIFFTQFKEEMNKENKQRMEEFYKHKQAWEENMEKNMEKIMHKLDHATARPTILDERASSGNTQRNDIGNLQLQFDTMLPDPIFTGRKLEGKGDGPIKISLIDKDTGKVVHAGPGASIKLDVVVLGGDFDTDDNGDWTQKQFEEYQLKERKGKPPLVDGVVHVTLKNGRAQLGDLKLTDNSSWYRSKTFRIGLKAAAPDCNKGIHIREAITNAFRVKDHRGEVTKKYDEPTLGDEVWRLKTIRKDGELHKKLVARGIKTVEDILRHLTKDSDELREIFGISKSATKWKTLVDHAKSCASKGKNYIYYDDIMKRAVVFSDIFQLQGYYSGEEYISVDFVDDDEKECLNSLMKKACGDWGKVEGFNSERPQGPMSGKNSSNFQCSDRPSKKATSAVCGVSLKGGNYGNTNTTSPYVVPSENRNINVVCCNPQLPQRNEGDLSHSLTVGHPHSVPSSHPPSGELLTDTASAYVAPSENTNIDAVPQLNEEDLSLSLTASHPHSVSPRYPPSGEGLTCRASPYIRPSQNSVCYNPQLPQLNEGNLSLSLTVSHPHSVPSIDPPSGEGLTYAASPHIIPSQNTNINGVVYNSQFSQLNGGDLSLDESSTIHPHSIPLGYPPSGEGCDGNMAGYIISSQSTNFSGLHQFQLSGTLNQVAVPVDLSLAQPITQQPLLPASIYPPSAQGSYGSTNYLCNQQLPPHAGPPTYPQFREGCDGGMAAYTNVSGLHQNQPPGTLNQATVAVDRSLTDPIQRPLMPAPHSRPLTRILSRESNVGLRADDIEKFLMED